MNNSSLVFPNKSATITADCVTCALFLDIGLEENLWWTSAISSTLVTVQYNVTQYNNSMYGCVKSFGYRV